MENALLVALGELVRQEISAEQMLGRIVDVVTDALGAERATIYLLDSERDELVSVVAHLPELDELRVPLGQGVAGHVARSRETVNIPNSSGDDRFWGSVDARTNYTTKAMLAGPLIADDGRVLGVAQVLNKRGGGHFSDRDATLFDALSEQAAALLEQTTLSRPEPTPNAYDEEGPALLGERFNRIVGQSGPMRAVYRAIRRVAPTEATVLLRGESGTGKGLVARALHYNSRRREGPFVSVDATTLPETLIENELFGHERGAYTGAHARRIGRVEAAAGGTLFLDEIGDMPLKTQGKLLTLLQDRAFYRVGGAERVGADLRIVAATNRDLEAMVARGEFREDLYYRLRVVQLELPPLRARGAEDVRALVEHFVREAARRYGRELPGGVRADAMRELLTYAWPGNVRELEHCIESAVIFAAEAITPSTLPLPREVVTMRLAAIGAEPIQLLPIEGEGAFEGEPTLRELEGRYIGFLLERHEGNRSAVARVLGIGRNTLLRKMREHGLG